SPPHASCTDRSARSADRLGAPPQEVAYSIRQRETFVQPRRASRAQEVLLSAWQPVQGFGILYSSVIVGVMNAKVWLRTFTSAIVCSIFGIWQATQSRP